MKYKEISKLARSYYTYMCDIFVESVWFIAHCAERLFKMVEVEGREIVNELQEKKGKVMIVMGHCGNWELMSAFVGEKFYRDKKDFTANPIYIVYKAAENGESNFLFKKIRDRNYKKFCCKGGMLESKSLPVHLMKRRDEKSTYLLIADQNPIGENPIVIDFLNQQTMMLRGPEYLSVRMKMPVVYMYMDRIKRGRYKISFSLITEDASKEEELMVTRKFAEFLEKDIEKNKVNWLWSHKRWKRKILK